MAKRTLCALALAVAVTAPAAAWAQSDDGGEEVEMGPDDGEEVTLDDDEPTDADLGAPQGAAENPGEIGEPGARAGVRAAASPAEDAGEYPLEVVRRPLTLPSGMSELSVDAPTLFDPFVFNGVVRAKYGLTREVELGLRYGTGAATEDGYEVGKALAVDALYQVEDWVAIQVAVPMLVDPFALAVTIGAPLKLRVGDRLALIAGRDLLTIRINRFVPVVENAAINEALVAAEAVGTDLDQGAINLIGGVIYQLAPDLAVVGETGILANDFSLNDSGMLLQGALFYSTSNKVDVGARLGFGDLNAAGETFGASVFAALRI